MSLLERLISRRSFDTMFGKAKVFLLPASSRDLVRILSVEGAYQSATYLEDKWDVPAFEYFRVFERALEPLETSNIRTLLLGGGGFALPKSLLTKYDDMTMDVVEIDPMMIDIARRYLYLDKLEAYLANHGNGNRLNIFDEDAIAFLNEDHGAYALIMNDLFSAFDSIEFFDTPQNITRIKSMLEPRGVYALNIVQSETAEEACRIYRLLHALDEVFLHTSILYAKDEEFGGADNYIIIATDSDYVFEDAMDFPR